MCGYEYAPVHSDPALEAMLRAEATKDEDARMRVSRRLYMVPS
jgi:hypothetical protein